VYIAEEISNNQFKIRGKAGMKIYWQVTGIRRMPGPTPIAFRSRWRSPSASEAITSTPSCIVRPEEKGVAWGVILT
jgi:hypothetical protein